VTAELSRKVTGASELCSAASNLPILRFSPRTPQRLRLGSFAPALAACSRGISERTTTGACIWSVWCIAGAPTGCMPTTLSGLLISFVRRYRPTRMQTQPTPDLPNHLPCICVHAPRHTQPLKWRDSGTDSVRLSTYGAAGDILMAPGSWATAPSRCIMPYGRQCPSCNRVGGADGVLTPTRNRLSNPVSRPDAAEGGTRVRLT
jgi:hypothetical protein